MILGLTDDLEIWLAREHGLDPFADEDAVVSDEDRDCSHAPIQHHSTGAELGRGHPDVGDASHTPRTPVSALESQAVGAQY